MIRIKICGITSVDDALAACAAGAHAIGFVFAESPRRISKEIAADIVGTLPPFVTAVGVFVDESIENVRETILQCGLHIAQLHGHEDVRYCRSLGIPFLKAFRLKGIESIEAVKGYQCDSFLVDGHSAGMVGGTGHTADWAIAAKVAKLGKMILAGGLTPNNVRTALDIVRPYAVDVSSGVESSPGKKDTTKIKQFIREVQTWDYQINGATSENTAAGLFPRR